MKATNKSEQQRYAAGMKVRRRVLGEAWVKKATDSSTDFTQEWQAQITRSVWCDVWTRPGIDPRTRSFMTLVLMISLGQWDEFNLHVEAAFNNGLTQDDIKEAILHASAYCGVPAGNHAFKEATATLVKIGRAPKALAQTARKKVNVAQTIKTARVAKAGKTAQTAKVTKAAKPAKPAKPAKT
ncbi:MAG: carboxymuconolactone decarboxylase family protein [Zwartia sp.]